jgi:magnesium transporter
MLTLIEIIASSDKKKFVWIDVVNPNLDDLCELAQKHNLPEDLVTSCLEPTHIVKAEFLENCVYLVLRAYDESVTEGDTVYSMTRKLVIFANQNTLLTVHRHPQSYLTALMQKYQSSKLNNVSWESVLKVLLASVVQTYDKPLQKLEESMSNSEKNIFLAENSTSCMRYFFHAKRQAGVVKSVLWRTQGVVHELIQHVDKNSRTLRTSLENTDRLHLYADEISEMAAGLLNLEISISTQRVNEVSQKTNEVMRVLTIFSAFFLPLSFIAGIYGMNFEQMPELRLRYGYPGSIALMAIVALSIYLWFRKKGWIHSKLR